MGCCAWRAALGSGDRNSGLVFAKHDGSPIHPDSFSQAFDRTTRASDVPRSRLHDLRHTHATLYCKLEYRRRS